MDEVLFRGSQKLEAMQMQADIVASRTKNLILSCSQATRALLLQVWQTNRIEDLKQNVNQLINYLLEVSEDLKDVANPQRLWAFLSRVLDSHWSSREVSIACTSFLVGGLLGVAIGLALKKRDSQFRYMEAVQISHYMGPEAATVVEDAKAPYECGDYDVLINVKAASVHIVDAQICYGYGRTFRRILRRLHGQSPSDLPVILGRDCTGIITDLGRKVRRLEIGDEVWVSVPFWSQGTLCQTVLISESRVARKPKNVGFEGACSIPYAGSLALSVLEEANVDNISAPTKRILIQDGCTPVGCVLIQLLNSWNAHVTTTCYKRAVPVAKALGATEIISIEDPQSEANGDTVDNPGPVDAKALFKELEVRGEQFDVIVITRKEFLEGEDLSLFCSKEGMLLSTAPEELISDSCGLLSRLLLAAYIRLKFLMQNMIGWPNDTYDEAHLCHATLERLTDLVEGGVLQTVVDKVFHPKDIEPALAYIQSPQSIGSTVVSFR